jgi:hypothetical protein
MCGSSHRFKDRVRVGVEKISLGLNPRSSLTPKGETAAQLLMCFIDSAMVPFRDDRARPGVEKISLGSALEKSLRLESSLTPDPKGEPPHNY